MLKILLLPLTIFLIDQISKIIIRGFNFPFLNIHVKGFVPGESAPIINNFFNITLVENPGIAFGIDPGESLRDLILIITILTCITILAYLIFVRNADIKTRIALALILGGASGNLFDRIFYGVFYNYAALFQGNVVDFLDIRFFKLFLFGNIHGNYVFNFADVSILAGVFLLIYLIMTSSKQKKIGDLIPQVVKENEE